MKRFFVGGAITALILGGTAVATAQTPECTAARDQVTRAQTAHDDALTAAIERARELQVPQETIDEAKAALADGELSDAEKASLRGAFLGVAAQADEADLALAQAVLDTRLTLNAAIAAEGIECNAETGDGATDGTDDDAGGDDGTDDGSDDAGSEDDGSDNSVVPNGSPDTGGGPVR